MESSRRRAVGVSVVSYRSCWQQFIFLTNQFGICSLVGTVDSCTKPADYWLGAAKVCVGAFLRLPSSNSLCCDVASVTSYGARQREMVPDYLLHLPNAPVLVSSFLFVLATCLWYRSVRNPSLRSGQAVQQCVGVRSRASCAMMILY